jgi:hypothetical protein
MSNFFKILQVFFLAMIKYFYAPIYGVEIGVEFWANFFALIAGGTIAFMTYYHFSKIVLVISSKVGPVLRQTFPESWHVAFQERKARRELKRSHRKKFTRRNKFMIKFRRTYGMWGVILLTPVFLSLPVGAFLLRKYYIENRRSVPLALLFIVIEGFMLCVGFSFLPRI